MAVPDRLLEHAVRAEALEQLHGSRIGRGPLIGPVGHVGHGIATIEIAPRPRAGRHVGTLLDEALMRFTEFVKVLPIEYRNALRRLDPEPGNSPPETLAA
mgnify:CR=1 FL=1